MTGTRRAILGAALAAPAVVTARAQAPTRITYLFPAPAFLQAFVPHNLALSRGYFAQEGLQVSFQTGRGGADAARQIGLMNAEVGGALGDTPMFVRPQGVPVRGVALIGGRPLFQVAVRRASGVRALAELRGKRIGVISFQDSGFFNLLAVLASVGIRRDDAQIQAVGNAGITQLTIAGSLDAVVATPEWAQTIEDAGVPLDYYPIDAVFPGMAQAILASDRIIAEQPQVVRGVVRAVVRALGNVLRDPEAAARDFCAALPQHAGKERETTALLHRYVRDVYATRNVAELGRFDPQRVDAVQRFYVEQGIIPAAVPVTELFTNEFVG